MEQVAGVYRDGTVVVVDGMAFQREGEGSWYCCGDTKPYTWAEVVEWGVPKAVWAP